MVSLQKNSNKLFTPSFTEIIFSVSNPKKTEPIPAKAIVANPAPTIFFYFPLSIVRFELILLFKK